MSDRGAAMILALLAAGLLTALGASLILVGDSERRIAANTAFGVAGAAAAEAALGRALVDLRQNTDWSGALAGRWRSAFFDQANLLADTATLQAETVAAGGLGANMPVWRVFASGSLAALDPAERIDSAAYLIAWIADDPFESDGEATADSNNMIVIRAEGRGPAGARHALEATVGRAASGEPTLIAWREVW